MSKPLIFRGFTFIVAGVCIIAFMHINEALYKKATSGNLVNITATVESVQKKQKIQGLNEDPSYYYELDIKYNIDDKIYIDNISEDKEYKAGDKIKLQFDIDKQELIKVKHIPNIIVAIFDIVGGLTAIIGIRLIAGRYTIRKNNQQEFLYGPEFNISSKRK